MTPPRILVAGVGNIFLGDDGFGAEVARRAARRHWPEGVRVRDFGIRALDLAYELTAGYAAAIIVDAAPRGGAPGTLYVIEPTTAPDVTGGFIEAHTLDLVQVLALARAMGPGLPRLLLVGCEPAALGDDDSLGALSPPVRAALDPAVDLVDALVGHVRAEVGAGA